MTDPVRQDRKLEATSIPDVAHLLADLREVWTVDGWRVDLDAWELVHAHLGEWFDV